MSPFSASSWNGNSVVFLTDVIELALRFCAPLKEQGNNLWEWKGCLKKEYMMLAAYVEVWYSFLKSFLLTWNWGNNADKMFWNDKMFSEMFYIRGGKALNVFLTNQLII